LKISTALAIAVAAIIILGMFKQTVTLAYSIAGIILLVWWLRWAQNRGNA